MVRLATLLCLLPQSLPAAPVSLIGDVHCDRRDALVTWLEGFVGAELQGGGLRGPDAVVELWAVPSSGDWTLVQSYPDGRSCVVAMGEHWEARSPLPDPA